MIDKLLSWFSPHICEGCGKPGRPLCKRCIFNILSKKYVKCVECGKIVEPGVRAQNGNLCAGCRKRLPFRRVVVIGERTGILKKLVGNFKYFSRRESANVIAELVANCLPPKLSEQIQLAYVPTAPAHIRERGFDHMKLVARSLARQTNLNLIHVLQRRNNRSQHSAKNLAERRDQAESAFSLTRGQRLSLKIILMDDIYTTGATVKAAAELLKQAGAQEIWLVIVARHVNDPDEN